ncbi:hypothetical protein [Hymenobacter metallicola]|uniref:Uncharacterized protein n=1 Tax=Hymenobacter metallicola TaxID=2563114 RepID=A0A4Z0Q0E8_9BACT|nr:hypothetical protein [Hymenobacter metallicola]TGE23500.1 hypothetical protein E5K02_20140 [Hymenobacter metallicola]
MSILATASIISPALVLLPSHMLARTACEFWLSNPLLVAKYPTLVAERAEQYPGWGIDEQKRLATRLQTKRDDLKHLTPVPAESIHFSELLEVLEAHEVLIDPRNEWQQARQLAMSCHPAEREWLLHHFRTVLKARSAEMEAHDSQDPDEYDEAA